MTGNRQQKKSVHPPLFWFFSLPAPWLRSAIQDTHDFCHKKHGCPGFFLGDWKGYNMQYGKYVEMNISSDGRVKAYAENQQLSGYINDERLYVADAEFHIERAGSGFNTVEIGNHSNQVHYERP